MVETSTTTRHWEEESGGGGRSGDDDPRSVRTIVLHELEWVKEADEDQIV